MASSRLKRKIEVADEGQYGNLTESFVSIGTALPALTDHKKDKNEFKPVWDQEVYDEQGRRRFHGAFTGGFSAGYYNSVGSKEGWKPSTFKSSRSQRASQQNQSVADAAKAFMDEEDLAEMASSRTIETSSSYASSSRAPPPAKEQEYDPLLGLFGGVPAAAASTSSAPQFDQTLASLIEPSSSRVGLKLMRKMGWREDQGVGPRVSYQQRKRQAAEIGMQLDQDEAEADGDPEAAKHYYAPLDRPLVLVKGSSTSNDKGWGLGYQPGMGLKETLRKEGGYSGSTTAKTMTYELDDDDVYGGPVATLGDLSDRQKRGIRAVDADEDDGGFPSMRSSRGGQPRQPRPRVSVPQDEFSDGSRLLPGFLLHREPFTPASSSQLPPSPPPGWRPDPSRLWKENQPPAAEAKGKGRQLDAEDRGSMLGEKAPPPMPKSVFDYLSAKSRERLASLTAPERDAKPDEGESRTTAAVPPPPPSDVPLFVPPLDRPTANAALRGFQPYSAASTSPDPIKQARYTLYLQYQASENASTTSSPFGPRLLPSGKLQTIEELNRELHEYSQAARVFKPVSGMLGNRFQTSQSGSLDVPKAEPGLYQPPPKAAATSLADKYGDAAAGNTKPPEPTLTPAQQAARAGNFGPLTRTTTVFRPARLLCKRFGVRDPHEAQGDEGGSVGGKWGEATATGREFGAGTSQPIGQAAIDEMMQSSGFQRFQAASKEVEEDAPEVAKGAFEAPAGSAAGVSTTNGAPKHRPAPTIETVGYGDDETQGEEIVAEKRAPADIFAAIFADSDDEDEDDSDDEPDAKPTLSTTEEDLPLPVDSRVTDPYAPKPAAAVAASTGTDPSDSTRVLSVDDLSSYKPSFVHAVDRTSNKTEKSPKFKKKSSKRKAGGLSFDLDEGGEDAAEASVSRKKAKKDDKRSSAKARDRDERSANRLADETRRPTQATVVEDDEWEEAAPTLHPDVLKATQRAAAAPSREAPSDTGGTARARPRAADLY